MTDQWQLRTKNSVDINLYLISLENRTNKEVVL